MEFDQAKALVKTKLEGRGDALTEIDEVALRAAWEDITYEEASTQHSVNLNTLKGHAAPLLWKTLSQIFGQKITKKAFRPFCVEFYLDKPEAQATEITKSNRQRESTTSTPKVPVVGAALPDVSNFYGREEELREMQTLLQRYPCVLIVGTEGIGKRSLVAKLLCTAELPFSQVVWKPLHHRPTADALESELLALLGSTEESLISALKTKQVLIVFDGIDAAITHEKPRGLDSRYMSLIRRLTEETPSRIIAISSEPIGQIRTQALRGKAAIYTLRGLELDAAKAIVQSNLDGRIEEIWQAVGGNPLMLKQVAQWSRYSQGLDPHLANRATVYRGLFDSLHEQTFVGSRLSTVDRRLLTAIAKTKEGILENGILSTYPYAAHNIQRLTEMGLVHRETQPGGAVVRVYEFFGQYLIEKTKSAV